MYSFIWAGHVVGAVVTGAISEAYAQIGHDVQPFADYERVSVSDSEGDVFVPGTKASDPYIGRGYDSVYT